MKIIAAIILIVSCTYFTNAQRILASNEFEADNVNSVTIKGSFCDVIVQSGSKVYFNGVIEGSGDEDDYEITSDLRGSDLYISVDKSSRSWDRISRAELKLTIPSGVEVSVDNSSGDIIVNDLDGRNFEFETSSGDIEISGAKGELEIESTSGDIEVENVVGPIYSESTSGSQEFNDIEGNLEARSTSGEIEIENLDGDVVAKSTSGDVDVVRIKGRINLKTTSGDIEGYDIEITDDAELRASSGDIKLEVTNNMEELSFDLQTSSGDLRAGGRSGDKSLYIKRGGYWVVGVTSSGDIRITN